MNVASLTSILKILLRSLTYRQEHHELDKLAVCLKRLLDLEVAIKQRNTAIGAANHYGVWPLAATASSGRKLMVSARSLLKEAELLPTEAHTSVAATAYGSRVRRIYKGAFK